MPGVEGLIHISELGADHRIKNASEVVSTGNLVEVMIIGIDPENKRLSLSLKALKPKAEDAQTGSSKTIDEDDWRNFSRVGEENAVDDDNPFKKLAKKLNDKKQENSCDGVEFMSKCPRCENNFKRKSLTEWKLSNV